MRARNHDGRITAAHAAEVTVRDGDVTFELDGELHPLPFATLEEEVVGSNIRLSSPSLGPARLVVDAAAWREATQGLRQARPRRLSREASLILGLVLAAGAVAAFVFVGMPLASGPLARHTPPDLERRIGANFEGQLGVAFPACTGQAGQQALQAFATRLQAQSSSPFDLDVKAVEAPMVNAFALPGGAIVVTDDLIKMAASPDELSAVIAHEAAHVEKRHVMQAVWRSLGLGLVLDAVVGGGSGAGQQAVLLAGSFMDLRYSRAAEAEADARGQELLRASHLSSAGMAPFFERLAAKGEGKDAAVVKELISSHPDSLRRARDSRARAVAGPPAFTPVEWQAIKASCKSDPKRPFGIKLP